MVTTKTNRIISFILVVCMLVGMLPTQVFATEIKNNSGATNNPGEEVVVEDADRVETIYTVKYYKDSIDSEDNLLGKYQVNSYVDYELNFDEINLNTYLPDGYDGGIVVKASSDNVVKNDGSSIVYVLYTPATPEGQELLNKVKAENEVVEDITELIVYIEDNGYTQYELSFATDIATIKSDVIPTDTILVIDGSLTMLNQTINTSGASTFSENSSTITGEEALYGMLVEFIEYYYETQPENSKLGIVIYGYNSMHGYDTVVELTELGDSTADAFIDAIKFPKSDWDWNNGVYALKKAKDMFLEAEHLYQGQDGNYYDRARHVIFFGSNSFANYQTFNEASAYNPSITSDNEAINQAEIIRGKLGDIILANNMGATLDTKTMTPTYFYGYGHKNVADKNEAWKNFVINDGNMWSWTSGNFVREQTGAGAKFHSVGLFTSKLSEERLEMAENLFKNMADKGEFYSGNNTADLYAAIEDIIADMYVSNDIYLDVIVDNNFKVIEAINANKVLLNSDDTTTVMYGPMQSDGIFHFEDSLVVAAKEEDNTEAPTYRVVAYTYVNGNKVILTQYDLVTDAVEKDWEDKGYTPISSFEYELVGTHVYLKNFIGDETEIKLAPSYKIGNNVYKVTRILDECFEGSDITSIEMSDSITNIGVEAFKNCSSLSKVTLPENLEAIYNGVFMNCTALKSIDFPVNMTYLGSYAFYNTGLTYADVSDNIYYIGLYCFAECKDLQNVDLSKSLLKVNNNTFENCVKLESVEIPDNVFSINDYAFNGCTSLTSISINKNTYMIGNYAFANCPNILEVTLPATSIYPLNAFAESNKLEKVTLNQGNYNYSLLANYKSNREFGTEGGNYENSLWQAHKDTVTTMVFEESVKTLGTDICNNMDALETVIMEDGITKIGAYCFYDCDALETIVFPSTLGSIPALTCFSCDNLKDVTFNCVEDENGAPHGIESIGQGAFMDCVKIEELVIPDSCISVDQSEHTTWEGAFYNCTGLTTLTIPINVKVDSYGLGSKIFYGNNITEVTFTRGTTGIGAEYGDFSFIQGLASSQTVTKVTFDEGITRIGKNTLSGTGIEDISIPSTLVEIGQDAFSGLGNVKKMAVDGEYSNTIVFENVTDIGNSAFSGFGFDGTFVFNFEDQVKIGDRAFYGAQLKEVNFNGGVSEVGSYAFTNATFTATQKKLNLDGCITLKDYALYGWSALEEITIGNTLEYIGTHAFDGCGVKELYLGTNVETIEPDAFIGASNLMHIEVDEANPYFEGNDAQTILWNEDKSAIIWVSPLYEGELYIPAGTTLTADLVRDHDYITKITFEPRNDLKVIPNNCFNNMDGLVEITLPEGVEIIGGGVFNNCISLKTINFPTTLKAIAPGNTDGMTFFNCVSLEKLVFPEGLVHIGGNWGSANNSCFYNCNRLETIYFPSTLVFNASGYYNGAFRTTMFTGCNSLAHIYIGDESTALSANSTFTKLQNIEQTVTYWSTDHVTTTGLTEIADYAFQNDKTLKRIDITDTVIRIGKYAFSGSGLAGVVTIPSSVVEIGTHAFNQTYVKELIVNANISTIPENFASNNPYLTTVVLPDTITTINKNAFASCTDLTNIVLPDGLTTLGNAAFNGCTSLETIEIPSGVTTLNEGLFYNCSSLKNVTLHDGLTTIGKTVFYNNTSLETLTIPASVTSIDASSLTGCINLHITVDANNPNYSTNEDGTILYNKNKTSIIWYNPSIKTIDLSDSNLTTVPGFGGNKVVEKVIFPDSATAVVGGAFQNCTSLTSVIMNEGLTKLNGNTFNGCTSLKEVTLPSTLQTVNTSDFTNNGLEKIYVADGSSYLTATDENTALYSADMGTCYWALEFFRVNGESFNDLASAINAASNGDTIYVVNSYNMTQAITIPANKELTFKPLEKNVVITTNGYQITNNSKITISGNNEKTLTWKSTSNSSGFNAYADIVIANGGVLYGPEKNQYKQLIIPQADITVTVKDGAVVGYANYFFSNGSKGTYVVEPGAKFDSLNYIIQNENGTYENLTATFINCANTLDRAFIVGDTAYSSLQTAVDAASNGDTIYVVTDTNVGTAVTIPADKELTIMALDKDVTITQSALITNNSKLTIKGNGEHTLTIQASKAMDQFNAYADIVIGDGAIVYGNAKGKNSIIVPKAVINLTVETGATMGYANYAYYNNNGATYTIGDSANFTNLNYIVYNANGSVGRKVSYDNCTNTLANNSNVAMVNDVTYGTLEDAINNAVDGDIIYIMDNCTLATAITIPADKELTIMPYDGNFTVSQSAAITNNSKLTIKGNGDYTLTFKATKAMDMFLPYADITVGTGAFLNGNAKGKNSVISAKAAMTLTVEDGAGIGYANYGFYNGSYGTYVIEEGAIFDSLTNVVANKNGTYINYTATFTNCDNILDMPLMVNGVGYDTLANAISAASDGDTIYVMTDYTLPGAITFPAGKELTLSAYNKDVTIYQTNKNHKITVNGALTITGNVIDDTEYTLTVQASTNVDQFLVYAPLTIKSGASVLGNGSYTNFFCYNGSLVVVEGGATVGNASQAWYGTGSYEIHANAKFVNLGNVVSGTHSGRVQNGVIYENVSGQLTANWEPAIMVNDERYYTLQEAIEVANDGDTIYILDNFDIEEEVIIPENKALTIMPYEKNVVITQLATITNNSALTLSGNGDYTLTLNAQNVDAFAPNEAITILEGAEVYETVLFGQKAAEANIVSGKAGWKGNYNGVAYTNCVDKGNDINFEFTAPSDGTYVFYATAAYNGRNFNLYVDDTLIGTYSDSLTEVELELTEGTHVIRVTNASGYPPIWDTFYVRYATCVNDKYYTAPATLSLDEEVTETSETSDEVEATEPEATITPEEEVVKDTETTDSNAIKTENTSNEA